MVYGLQIQLEKFELLELMFMPFNLEIMVEVFALGNVTCFLTCM